MEINALQEILAAIDLHGKGRLQEAADKYKRVIASDPDHHHALFGLAVTLGQQGQSDEAIATMRQAIERSPGNALYLETLGNQYMSVGRYREAAEAYAQALAINPQNPAASIAVADALQKCGDYAGAIETYAYALRLAPTSTRALINIGAAYLGIADYRHAAEYLEMATRLDAGNSEALNNLGVANKGLQRYEEALDCYDRAIQADPNNSVAMLNAGAVCLIRKDYAACVRWNLLSLSHRPEQVEAHQNLAVAYRRMGRLDVADEHRQAAYTRQCVFFDYARQPVRTLLLLNTSREGNIPTEHIVVRERNNVVTLMLDFLDVATFPGGLEFDLIFNAIGDPDSLDDAQVFAKLAAINPRNRPMLNAPDKVQASCRDNTRELLAHIEDVYVPPTSKATPDALEQHVAAFLQQHQRAIVRPARSHGGDHVQLVAVLDDLKPPAHDLADVFYVTEFVDYRSDDDYFRKYRIIYVDRRPYPYHLAIGQHWMIHYETADMPGHPWKLDEELRFLADPATAIGQRAMQAINAIGTALDLDYVGIDFTILKNGQILVFEANPTMLVHPEDPGGPLAHKNSYVREIIDALDARMSQLATAH